MRRTRRRTQAIEQLEVRQLMSARPLGSPIQVNAHTSGASDPFTAAVPGGGFVTVFRDNLLDGDEGGIYARRYNSNGVALGTHFRVNNVTAGDQSEPTVAVDKTGKVSYAWMSYNEPWEPNPGYTIHSRRYNSDGTAIGNSKHVMGGEPPTADGEQIYAASDDFVHSFTDAANNTILIGLTNYEERFRVVKLSPTGTILSKFTINTLTGFNSPAQQSNLWRPSHSALVNFEVTPSGEILVGYELTRDRLVVDVGNRTDFKGIVRRFSTQGTRLNDILVYSTTIDPTQAIYPTFAVHAKVAPDGNLSVLYTSPSRNLLLRKYTLSGSAVSSYSKVTSNSASPNSFFMYDFDILPNGHHVVAWNRSVARGKDQSFIQEFDASLKPVGAISGFDGESDYTYSWQITALSNSRVIVTWEENKAATDLKNNNAMVQRFRVGNDVVPVISNAGATTVPYKAGAAATGFLKSAIVSDADDTNLSGHTLRVQITSGASSTNQLTFPQISPVPAPGAKGFYFREDESGSRTLWYAEHNRDSVPVADFQIGTLNKSGGVGFTPFEVTFNFRATKSLVQTFIRSLRFSTTNATSKLDRVLKLSIINDLGASSNSISVKTDVT